MYILGVDPGTVNIGWSVIRTSDKHRIAGGTLVRIKLNRALATILRFAAYDIDTDHLDAIGVERGNSDSCTIQLIGACRDFGNRVHIPVYDFEPWRYRGRGLGSATNHERDAHGMAILACNAFRSLQ